MVENFLSQAQNCYLVMRLCESWTRFICSKVRRHYASEYQGLSEQLRTETSPAKRQQLELALKNREHKTETIVKWVGRVECAVDIGSFGLDCFSSMQSVYSNSRDVYSVFMANGAGAAEAGAALFNVPQAIVNVLSRTPIISYLLKDEPRAGRTASTNSLRLFTCGLIQNLNGNFINRFGITHDKILFNLMQKAFAYYGLNPLNILTRSCIPIINYLQLAVLGYEAYKTLNFTLPKELLLRRFHNEVISDKYTLDDALLFAHIKNEILQNEAFRNDKSLYDIYIKSLYFEYIIANKFELKQIASENDSLFEAVACYTEETAEVLKNQAQTYIEQHKPELQDSQWKSIPAIHAFQKLLKRPIIVLDVQFGSPIFPTENDLVLGDPIFIGKNGNQYFGSIVRGEEYITYLEAKRMQAKTKPILEERLQIACDHERICGAIWQEEKARRTKRQELETKISVLTRESELLDASLPEELRVKLQEASAKAQSNTSGYISSFIQYLWSFWGKSESQILDEQLPEDLRQTLQQIAK